jgi:hypothetical protein
MQKIVLFLLFSFYLATTVLAQQQPAPGHTELTAGRRDTLRAVRNLFERRRTGGRRWLYASGGGVLAVTRALISANSTTNGVRTTSEVKASDVATLFGVVVGLPAAIGIGKLVRFSDKREEAITVPYATGQPLPRRIARRLRRKDFE